MKPASQWKQTREELNESPCFTSWNDKSYNAQPQNTLSISPQKVDKSTNSYYLQENSPMEEDWAYFKKDQNYLLNVDIPNSKVFKGKKSVCEGTKSKPVSLKWRYDTE